MSTMSIGQPAYYQIRLTLGTGVIAPQTVANFSANSRLLSIVRINANGGVTGTPTAVVLAPTTGMGSPAWRLGLNSSVNTDVSTYQINWVNQVTDSPLYPSTDEYVA